MAVIPSGAEAPPARAMGEGETFTSGSLTVTAFRTPGHCAMHNCYHVRSTALPSARSLLISGDLVFAGSAGGPYYCQRQLREHLQRVLAVRWLALDPECSRYLVLGPASISVLGGERAQTVIEHWNT